QRLTELLLLAIISVIGHTDAASAQTMVFSPPNPITLSIPGPGATTSATVSLVSPASVTQLNVGTVGTNSGNWLCATANGTTLTINVGSLCAGGSTNQFVSNQQGVNGFINLTATGASPAQLTVLLNVGNSSVNSNGLVATPNPMSFNIPVGSSFGSNTIN